MYNGALTLYEQMMSWDGTLDIILIWSVVLICDFLKSWSLALDNCYEEMNPVL